MQYHLPHLSLFPSSATTASSFAREKRRSTIWVPLFCTTTTDIDAMNIVRVVGCNNDVEEKDMDPEII